MILIPLTIPILLHRFQWRIVEALPLPENRYQLAPVFHEVGSVKKNFLVRETKSTFSHHSPRNFSRSPRSLVWLNISFPLLRRPSAVAIPLWVACWREAFHKLLMVKVVGSFQLVYAYIKSPRSFLFLNDWFPWILTSVMSLPRAYWSRGWQIRGSPCNKIHHSSRCCCDSFFSWIVLRSFSPLYQSTL